MNIFTPALFLISMIGYAMCISVPTGKRTPITPAKPTPVPIYHKIVPPAAPVVEYTEENPEPPPLDPSYVPITYKYINALIAHGHYYIPIRLKMPVYNAPIIDDSAVEISDVYNPIPAKTVDKYVTNFVKKPLYFVPKPYPNINVSTKGGYPKKALSHPTEKHYWMYRNNKNLN